MGDAAHDKQEVEAELRASVEAAEQAHAEAEERLVALERAHAEQAPRRRRARTARTSAHHRR